jgi:hypothetical protein
MWLERFPEIAKAVTHKYLRKIPLPGGGYRYVYAEAGAPGHKTVKVPSEIKSREGAATYSKATQFGRDATEKVDKEIKAAESAMRSKDEDRAKASVKRARAAYDSASKKITLLQINASTRLSKVEFNKIRNDSNSFMRHALVRMLTFEREHPMGETFRR